uniref:Uncharacterized protein n=1 Tax=Candidatus Kentrum sp. LPFa TaxID=2126335 RepID=A0A450W0Y1_9GAMM|nr:MAG: hypothetical protein BECKLPF1236B_GA0070989_101514 [Candidatus Kentron sp. LPFa]
MTIAKIGCCFVYSLWLFEKIMGRELTAVEGFGVQTVSRLHGIS